ncbi:Murein endolytic transglycosylase MltG [Olavius sp. associated proteobacterium Delta 1]|nr:Murein endolytic transglycosylase MltG [Olavius sp. associated proteobacterium Delta 1]
MLILDPVIFFHCRCARGAFFILKKALLLIGISIFLIVCAGLGIYIELRMYADVPAQANNTHQVVINVRQGQSLQNTADLLYQKNIIKNSLKLVIIARVKGYDKRLKAGEYLLSAAMTPRQILEIMVKGEVKLHKLTVPEGYNTYQIAELVSRAGFGTKDEFRKAASDAALAHKLGLEADLLEGYLFPDTYFFPKDVTVEKIISTMVQRFRSIFKPEWKDRAKSNGFSVHQVVTLASIIEKETGAPFERPRISSVFHNRLRKKMRLESDPTVIYGIKNFDGNLTRKHLKTRTPYNTYKIRGLPVGPIANPGRASLEAALFPEKTAYIYFVSKKDTTHHFSTNLKEHNRAVRKYQLGRK